MDIFHINSSVKRKHPEITTKNILIVENNAVIGINNTASFKSFLITLFGGRWVFDNFVGIKKKDRRVIIHMRGSRADIDNILSTLNSKFVLTQRSISCYSPGCFWNAPYYRKRRVQQNTAYGEALGRILTRIP